MRKCHQLAAAIFILHLECQLVFGYTYLYVCKGHTFCEVRLLTPLNSCNVVHSDTFDCYTAITNTHSYELFAFDLFLNLFGYVTKGC